MSDSNVHCIMPARDDLMDKIVRSKQRILAGQPLPAPGDSGNGDDVLDNRTFALIAGRPKRTRADTFSTAKREAEPIKGERKALVLLVDFEDEKPPDRSQSSIHDMLFSTGAGSMRTFFTEASYGALDVTGLVSGEDGPTTGWYRAPQPKSFYTNGNYSHGAYPNNSQRLVEDLIALARPHVNFKDYDSDGDDKVDSLIIIAAGSGAEVTGDVDDIWSHKWAITPTIADGVTIETYFIAPENGKLGVMCHELGHLLFKWPDLYDTDYDSKGTGKWDLMAGGSWNDGGDRPAHPTAWCKTQVGWVVPTTVFAESRDVTIQPYATDGQVYKLPLGGADSKEYFLLSNRKKTGFDDKILGEGLIIEHVDDSQSNNTDQGHYLVDIEQADGRRDLNDNVNPGDSGDPFPTESNMDFTGSSNPSSKSYGGSDSSISVTDIKRTGNNVTASITVGGAAGSGWHNHLAVVRTYATHHTQNAWANIGGLGWKKIKTGQADGVTNLFVLLCEAHAKGRTVNVLIDSSDRITTAYMN